MSPAEHNDLVSYVLGSSGVIYGILLGLVAAGVWRNFQSLSSQVDEEATLTAALYQHMATYQPPYEEELKAYVQSVIQQDWTAHHQGRVPQESSKILRSFKNPLFNFVPSTHRMQVVLEQAINQLNELLIAHRFRLRGDQADLPEVL